MILGVAAIAAALGIISFTSNRLVRRKLRLSVFLLAAFAASDLVLIFYGRRLAPETIAQLGAFTRLAVAAAMINAAVALLINPLREDRVPERFPTILQDALVIGLVLLASTFLSQQLLTTSAVSAVVLGFALQDTLGNAFAGLAIQSEKPFSVGHWVKVGDHEGRVAEVTWRATKLRTKAGNFVILPNDLVAKEPIINYSEPAAPVRLFVEIGASYDAAPNQVKAAIHEAMRHSTRVLPAPAADVVLLAFDASAITYRARFWIADFEGDEAARDEVRAAIYYAFRRHGIEIPFPIQVQYERDYVPPDDGARIEGIDRTLAGIELFTTLSPEMRREVAAASRGLVYGNGETVVRHGEEGTSMFVVRSGLVSIVLADGKTEVARTPAGGYFGEMSLLTGEPRSATVRAIGDVEVVEIGADLFRRLASMHPAAIEAIGVAALTRRAELEAARASVPGVPTVPSATLIGRMKKFLRLA